MQRQQHCLMMPYKQHILDMLSVTFDGLDLPASEVAFRFVSPSEGRPCTVIGRNATTAAADTAFVNAVTGTPRFRRIVEAEVTREPSWFRYRSRWRVSTFGQRGIGRDRRRLRSGQRMNLAAGTVLHSNGCRRVRRSEFGRGRLCCFGSFQHSPICERTQLCSKHGW